MRVLFTATPGWGHIHPMVPLARAFVERGDEVLWATARDAALRLDAAGFRTKIAGVSEREAFAKVSHDPEILALAPEDRPQRMGPKLFATVRAPIMLAELMPIAQSWAPDLLVCDQLELAGPMVAAQVGVANVTHSFGPLLPPERLAAMSEIVAPLWGSLGLEPSPFAGTYDHSYLDIYPPSLQSDERSHVASSHLLRPVAFATGADEMLPAWVSAEGPPLVYITFGTVFSDPTILTSLVTNVSALDVRVVATVGPHIDPQSLGVQTPNVHVAQYIPQRQLLPHCAAVVSHGGSGTFLASLAAGVPQLCLPQGADQFINAAACARAGVGLSLSPDQATPSQVVAAVSRLLAESTFKESAQSIGIEIDSMPTPEQVAAHLHSTRG